MHAVSSMRLASRATGGLGLQLLHELIAYFGGFKCKKTCGNGEGGGEGYFHDVATPLVHVNRSGAASFNLEALACIICGQVFHRGERASEQASL